MITLDLEVLCKARFTKHGGCVAADEHGASGFKAVMIIKHKAVRCFVYCTEISGVLPVVFATVF